MRRTGSIKKVKPPKPPTKFCYWCSRKQALLDSIGGLCDDCKKGVYPFAHGNPLCAPMTRFMPRYARQPEMRKIATLPFPI